MDSNSKWSHTRFVLYILSFLFTLHYALPSYIGSSFLGQWTSQAGVGYIYSAASALTILIFCLMPRIMRRWGNYRVMFTLLIIESLALIGLATFSTFALVTLLFMVSFIAVALINFNMDVFLENITFNSMVGTVRGLFLASGNVAWVVASIITSFILTGNDYWKMYLAAAIIIVPVIVLLDSNLRDFKDPQYVDLPIFKTIREIWNNKDIFCAFMSSFLLQFFYAWMVIYTPLYLHERIGFGWGQIGVMFSIMLMPFVLTEAPLGRLADERWGEKEVMSIGFIILAVATGLISFFTSNNIFLWATILFVTRIGASMVEVMTDTYFFKKVTGVSAHVISFYRTMRPFAYLVSPLVATALLSLAFFDFKYIFAVLGIIMLYGLRWSLALTDTR